MVRILILAIVTLSCFMNANAQYSSTDANHGAGTLAASMTFSPTMMLNRDVNNFYLSGYLLYKMDRKFSVNGITHYYLNSSGEPYYDQAMRTYFGVFYHFPALDTKTPNFDYYLGLQPGTSFTRRTINEGATGKNPIQFTPSAAVTFGTTLYFYKYFNFFANLTYLASKQPGLNGPSERSDELMFSAGLGFHINTKKH